MTPPDSLREKQPISTSLFYMWRCVIALAHADGRVQDEERAYLTKIFSNMGRINGLTEEQKSTFTEDLFRPQKMSDLLPYINDPAIRSQLVYFAGLLARTDGELHPNEAKLLEKLRADQLSGLNLEQIRADVHNAVTDQMFQHDLETSSIRPQSGLSALIDSLLLRMGIDILD